MTPSPEPAPPARPGGLGYMPGIDGLRAVAVAAVVVFHLGASWLPGGFLGVDVFLVISGFLITSLLLAEHRRSGRIDLPRFWIRRARRLLPALFVMMALVLAVMAIAHPGEVGRLRGQALAAALYVVNWHFIYADVPYFAQFGRPSAFLHLWSLAIEEQFYLVWPPVLALGLAVAGRRALTAGVAVATAASATLAWVLWEPYTDPSRIYYGTDTRAVALLAGVGLALGAATAGRLPAPRGAWVTAAGVACAVYLGYAMATLGDLDERLYRGGFALVALASAVVVAAAADARAPLGRLLGVAPLVWLGLRSYSIYLWHWPIIVLTRPDADVPLDGPVLVALRVGLTILAADLSYRYVETPFRRHGLAGVRAGLRRLDATIGRRARLAGGAVAAGLLAALVLAVALLPVDQPRLPSLAAPATGAPAADAARRPPVLFVGDSVMLSAAPALRRAFGPRAVIDAAAGRRFPEGAALVLGHLRTMPPGADVVIHLGNNDFIRPRDLDALLARLAGRPRVDLVTVRVPLPWQDSVNESIRAAARTHPNVQVIDWRARSGGPGLLVDGAHMNARGARLYAALIAGALAEDPAP